MNRSRNRVRNFAFVIVTLAILLMLGVVFVRRSGKKDTPDESVEWAEVNDYDIDGQWDTLEIKRDIWNGDTETERRTKSMYHLLLSSGAEIEMGPFANTAIWIQCDDVTGDGKQEIVVNTAPGMSDDFRISEILIYSDSEGEYKTMELPKPEEYQCKFSLSKYVVGYDLYVLNVNENTVTIGNEEYGIQATFQITAEVIDSKEYKGLELQKLYEKAAEEKKIIGDRAFEADVVDGDNKSNLALIIPFALKGSEKTRAAFVTIEYRDGTWVVLQTKVEEQYFG